MRHTKLMTAAIIAIMASMVYALYLSQPRSYADIVRATSPAVVSIFTRKIQRPSGTRSAVFEHFFTNPFTDKTDEAESQGAAASLGSGVIIDAQGIIVTNYHVIEESEAILVMLPNGSPYDADIIVSDPRTDVAMLRLRSKSHHFPFVPLADSDHIHPGDRVLAIGNPYGVGQSVSQGVISALARSSHGIDEYSFFIQTDAAVNPGSSGGALIDMTGELVGMTTQIFSYSGGSHGINFAIPSNLIRTYLHAIHHDAIVDGTIIYPWIGAEMTDVTPTIADAYGLSAVAGVLVDDIYKEGPAHKAGLQTNDIIMAINDHAVQNSNALFYYMATLPVEKAIEIEVLRQHQRHHVMVMLELPPEIPDAMPRAIKDASPLQGAEISNISPRLASKLNVPLLARGVVISKVSDASIAKRLGLMAGDRIRAINHQPIEGVEGVMSLLPSAKAPWHLSVQRGKDTWDLTLRALE